MIVPEIKVENPNNGVVGIPYLWIDGDLYKVKTLTVLYDGESPFDEITINITAKK